MEKWSDAIKAEVTRREFQVNEPGKSAEDLITFWAEVIDLGEFLLKKAGVK